MHSVQVPRLQLALNISNLQLLLTVENSHATFADWILSQAELRHTKLQVVASEKDSVQ